MLCACVEEELERTVCLSSPSSGPSSIAQGADLMNLSPVKFLLLSPALFKVNFSMSWKGSQTLQHGHREDAEGWKIPGRKVKMVRYCGKEQDAKERSGLNSQGNTPLESQPQGHDRHRFVLMIFSFLLCWGNLQATPGPVKKSCWLFLLYKSQVRKERCTGLVLQSLFGVFERW